MAAPTDVPADVWAALRSCKVLSEASDESLAWLARVSSIHAFNKGDRVLSENTAAREIGIVMRGHVRAVHFGSDGRPVTVLMAWPCEPIGLMAALAGDDYRTSFESAENGTSIVLFSLDAFTRLTRDEPDVLVSVVRELARQMTDMVTMVKTLAADVPARVAIYIGLLLEEQEPTGKGPFEVNLGVPRVELAARLGTVPETLSRAFHLLQTEQIIESHGQQIVVLDRDALIDRTNGVL
jgi:CRP/FNR family transcriptional regulator, dissimilatory nitrate respiration regulator